VSTIPCACVSDNHASGIVQDAPESRSDGIAEVPRGRKEFAGTSPNGFISLGVLFPYKTAFDSDFSGADVHASRIKMEDAEALASGKQARKYLTRLLPPVSGEIGGRVE
jgi:hypothetical protein